MKAEVLSWLKKTYLKQYGNDREEQLLGAPLLILRGITAQQAKKLAKLHGVSTIGELLKAWPLPQAWGIAIDPALIGVLICNLLYPKYDPGPPCSWERLFESAPLDKYVNHPSGRFRTQFGPVFYRGRLDGSARVLVVGQDPSTDELIAHRNLVGDAGQKLQHLLNKLGITRSYVMLNSFLFGITGQFDAAMQAISLEADILDYRNQLFDKVAAENPLEAIFAFGNGAQHSVAHWPGHAAYTVVEWVHPSAPDTVTLPDWNSHLAEAQALVQADVGATPDLTPYGSAFTPADSTAIPRADLPFGIPHWHGTQGTRSHRNGAGEIIWDAVT